MKFDIENSALFDGAYNAINFFGGWLPFEYSGPRSEFMAARESAWLGVNLNFSPAYDVWGPDVFDLMNHVCVNRDFAKLAYGASRHAVMCDERGRMLADGVVIKVAEDRLRCYFLAPVLQFHVENGKWDVEGAYVEDEYFYQIDGPKSLEIMEEACQTDLHDLKFAHNKQVEICGTPMTVHRLGMSGALAYEVHGPAEHAELAYRRIRAVLEAHGGKPQGTRNYSCVNHTVAGYANQMVHYVYPLFDGDPELARFCEGKAIAMPLRGSAADVRENFYLTPYDVNWDFLVNFDHDFIGKEALLAASQKPARKMVSLEWNADDVADVFRSQFQGVDAVMYDPAIDEHTPNSDASGGVFVRGDYVVADGRRIGVATGKTNAYFERKMVSLARIDAEYAVEGREVTVMWGDEGWPVKEIRATVAQFPYYQGEYRNETFDVESIPRPAFSEGAQGGLSGHYDVEVIVAGQPNPGTFDYEVEGGVLTGTATAMGNSAPVDDGIVSGNRFSHTMRIKTPMGKMKVSVDGTFEGDRIEGTLKAMLIKMPFTGKRA